MKKKASKQPKSVKAKNGASAALFSSKLTSGIWGNLFFVACGMLSLPALALGGHWLNKTNQAPQAVSHAQMAQVGHVRPASLATTGTSSAPNENESFTYDSVGRVLTANNGFAQISYSYDSIGRRSSMTQTVGGIAKTVNFTYDTANRLISRSIVGAATETRTYTSRNQIETIRLDGVLVVTFIYDSVGREISRVYGNGVVTNSGFARADNMITSIEVPNKPELSFTYNYDSNKNVTGETRGGTMSNASWAATFDEMDRINTQNGVGSAQGQHSWVRDPVGNTTAESIDGINQTRMLNNLHAPVTAGNKAFAYDINGQMTSKNDIDLTWDVRNKLVETKDAAHPEKDSTLYQYDALGNRISKGDTRYLVVDGQVLAEYTSNEVKQFVHGGSIDDVVAQTTSGGLQYFHKNRQMNTAGVTDVAGNVVELYNIDAVGRVKAFDGLGAAKVAPAATDRLFTGRTFDRETGLHYFRARYFEPEVGGFASQDPLGFVDGYSLYNGYFSNNFTTDAFGYCAGGCPGKEVTMGPMKFENILSVTDVKFESGTSHFDSTTGVLTVDNDAKFPSNSFLYVYTFKFPTITCKKCMFEGKRIGPVELVNHDPGKEEKKYGLDHLSPGAGYLLNAENFKVYSDFMLKTPFIRYLPNDANVETVECLKLAGYTNFGPTPILPTTEIPGGTKK